jgi:signal transduction histidine kinase
LADADGTLWIGTPGNGLVRLKDNQWTRFTTREGLADNSVYYLLDDAAGFLWIGSNAGLLRVPWAELNELAARKRESVSCRAYSTQDGLPTSTCTSGSQPAAWRAGDGKLWFATTKGLVSVVPTQLARNTNPPPVVIESVVVDDELQNTNRLRLSLPSPLRIPPGRELLEIRYTSLNLLASDRTRFKYQMEGYDEMTDAGSDRVVRYPKLPHGEYLFRVIAANEDGVWNEAGATLAIVVEPAFWQTWWFRSLAVVGLVGAIVGVVYFISTQKLQRQLARLKQQEAVERERARIARDLHDQLGANLTQVSLLGEMVETDKDLPEEVETHAKQISQTARLTSAALDEIVWAANPSNDTLEGLVNYACKYAQEYLAVANLSYRLEAPDKLPPTPIPPDVRHNVFLAFKESINNVVKHAQARTVKVRFRLDGQQFTCEIEDDGRGLPPDARDKGRNGLRNMRKRMEDVGGGFAAEPAPERGTIVRLTAPFSPEVRP